MRVTDYPKPVRALFALGEPEDPWINYWSLDIVSDHVPDLLRILDAAQGLAARRGPAFWAPVHAWRALAQMATPDAVGPLLRLIRQNDEVDDWMLEELPHVFGMLGAPALPGVASYLAEPGLDVDRALLISHAVMEIGVRNPRERDGCVAVLTGRLEKAEEYEPTVNAAIILALLGLGAVEAEPLIERAYALGRVDETGVGGLEQVRAFLRGDEDAFLALPELVALTMQELAGKGILPPAPKAAPASRGKRTAKARKKPVREAKKDRERR